MKTIKIGRKTFDVKSGDYILFNDACYQFCSGDNRALYREKWSTFSNIRIPKSVLKTIDLDSMRKEQKNNLTYWYF